MLYFVVCAELLPFVQIFCTHFQTLNNLKRISLLLIGDSQSVPRQEKLLKIIFNYSIRSFLHLQCDDYREKIKKVFWILWLYKQFSTSTVHMVWWYLRNSDPNAKSNTSEPINKFLKTFCLHRKEKYQHHVPIILQLQNGPHSTHRCRGTIYNTTIRRINCKKVQLNTMIMSKLFKKLIHCSQRFIIRANFEQTK